MFGGRGGCGPSARVEEVCELALERRVGAALEADRRRGLRAHRRAAERAGDVAREDLDAVPELGEAAQAVEEALGALLASTARSGRPASPTKSESPVRTSHGSSLRERSITAKQQCSGRCPGVWIVAQDDVADLDLRPVLERLVREGRPGLLVDADRDAVLEREAAVSRDVVGVRVRLEDADQPDVVPLDLCQHGFDVIRRVDDDRDAGVLVADEVRGAAQVIVQELLEQHGATLPPCSAMYPKAAPARANDQFGGRSRRNRSTVP